MCPKNFKKTEKKQEKMGQQEKIFSMLPRFLLQKRAKSRKNKFYTQKVGHRKVKVVYMPQNKRIERKYHKLDSENQQVYTKCTKIDSTLDTAERRDAYETIIILTFCYIWSKDYTFQRKETDSWHDYRDG